MAYQEKSSRVLLPRLLRQCHSVLQVRRAQGADQTAVSGPSPQIGAMALRIAVTGMASSSVRPIDNDSTHEKEEEPFPTRFRWERLLMASVACSPLSAQPRVRIVCYLLSPDSSGGLGLLGGNSKFAKVGS